MGGGIGLVLADRLVREVDSGLHVRNTVTYANIVARSIVTERIMATLGGFFGVLALGIAGLGLFGVLTFQVARRTHELGVRLALGASRSAVLRLVMREVVWTVAGGVTIGAAAALTLTDRASTFLFGLEADDPVVFMVACIILAAVAVVAASLPAHRASRVDPLVALRHE